MVLQLNCKRGLIPPMKPSFLRGLALATFVLSASPDTTAQEKVKVVTTFTVIADMAREVAGDAAEVESITKPGAEIHTYQPTPRANLRAREPDHSSTRERGSGKERA